MTPTLKRGQVEEYGNFDEVMGYYIEKSLCPTKEKFIAYIKGCSDEKYSVDQIKTAHMVKIGLGHTRFVNHKTPKSYEVWITDSSWIKEYLQGVSQ